MSQTLRHLLPAAWATRAWRVIVVGAGGTGSAVLPNLARLHHAMVELGHPGGIHCTVYDDDVVSATNVGRQGFYPNDVGRPKASLIVNRLNLLMGTNWQAETVRFDSHTTLRDPDLVVGCVDTRGARAAILRALEMTPAYYLDCGNSTDSGQVVLGQVQPVRYAPPIVDRLPHVGDLFPEMVDFALDRHDEAPSCSMADALRKQSLVINQAIAVQAFNLLWTMFRQGAVSYSGVFVNLKTGRTNPIPVDPATWARFGYVPRPVPKKRVRRASSNQAAL